MTLSNAGRYGVADLKALRQRDFAGDFAFSMAR
jgi:hypothetical protein